MTDDELHREEWIEERIGMLMEDLYPADCVEEVAARMWLEYEADRKQHQIDAGATQ
jgi:hypothetical protein